jgi:hypothetical protein
MHQGMEDMDNAHHFENDQQRDADAGFEIETRIEHG